MQHVYRTTTTVGRPLAEVFAFFSDAANLQRITPPELHFRIETPLPVDMREGALIVYRLRLFGVPFRWKTRISRWNPPLEFVDEQVRGPYREWIHTHRFQARGDSTGISDQVQYRLPLWPLGELAYPLVRLQIGRIFRYRKRILHRLLEQDTDSRSR